MDSLFLKQQAERCRSLADQADPFTKKRLLDLALKYEARSKIPAKRRSFGIPGSLLEARMQIPSEPPSRLVSSPHIVSPYRGSGAADRNE